MKKIINKKNKTGVSAVLGVILMVAITVAIAATVYYYVSTIVNSSDNNTVICGKIKYIPVNENWKHYGVVQIDNNSFYSLYTMNDRDYSILKFAYKSNCTVSFIIYTMYDGDLAMLGDSVNLINCGCKE
jgi:ABC-type maltose transport system permease subunit